MFLDEHAERLARAVAVADGRWVRIEGAGHTVQGEALHGEHALPLAGPQ